jgi:hypothetical protein
MQDARDELHELRQKLSGGKTGRFRFAERVNSYGKSIIEAAGNHLLSVRKKMEFLTFFS